MLFRFSAVAVLGLGWFVACGGGDDGGVTTDTSDDGVAVDAAVDADQNAPGNAARVQGLTAPQLTSMCTHLVDVSDYRVVDCAGHATKVGVADEPTCEMDYGMLRATCNMTVGDLESCLVALNALTEAQVCAFEFPPACTPVIAPECN
jgi:hypothetical protein